MTEPGNGSGACSSCGRALAPSLRFCTHCGAAVAAMEAPTAEAPALAASASPPPLHAPPPPRKPPPRPPEQSRPQWALDTPPANERWWHNPIVLIATAVTLVLGGGGVASWRFFAASSRTASVVRALPSVPPPDGSATQTAPAPTPDVSTPVFQIQRILVRSEAGRAAALRRHDYGAALRNRTALLAALDDVAVPAQPVRLARAYATLRAAIGASARADSEHLACGCDTLLSADVTASQLKRRFATLFDPYARRYLGGPVDANRI